MQVTIHKKRGHEFERKKGDMYMRGFGGNKGKRK